MSSPGRACACVCTLFMLERHNAHLCRHAPARPPRLCASRVCVWLPLRVFQAFLHCPPETLSKSQCDNWLPGVLVVSLPLVFFVSPSRKRKKKKKKERVLDVIGKFAGVGASSRVGVNSFGKRKFEATRQWRATSVAIWLQAALCRPSGSSRVFAKMLCR